MDPVSAFGLAANILQFIDLTSKLFSAGYQLHQAGTSQLELDLGLVIRDLGDVTRGLNVSLRPPGVNVVLNADDQALQSLAVECVGLSDELTLHLEKLRLDGKRKSKWRTFRQVLKAFWEEETINAAYKKLENLRNELILRLSVMTKKNTDLATLTQAEGFRNLDQRTEVIIRRLVEAPEEIISSLNAQNVEADRRHDQSDALAIRLQQETISAINRIQPAVLYPDPLVDTPSPGPPRIPLSIQDTTQKLIDMLKFRQMFSRQNEVAVAHPDTFRWIFTDEAQNRNKGVFSPLLPWLRNEEGAYWVSGKAGSGKSTLMKFLGSSKDVRHALEHWAHPQRLIVASFYFWRSGTDLQRSQEGLLRWLLYTILSQLPELVRNCFPVQFDELKDGNMDIAEITPTLKLAINAFHCLSHSDLGAFKIFLFIDGIDEFEGDHVEISNFFRGLASTPSFKIILSSRAIPACVDAFKELPSLRLQDFNHKDIQAYVEATIGKHERMDMLLSENKREASKLVDMILLKASGVFLWVRLVVKSLLDGFRNYDRISDLQDRVDEYPAELGSLYLHMFRSMETRYQLHAAQLLRIVIQSIEVQKEKGLTVLQLSFADESNLSLASSAPIRPMDEKERKARCEAMAGRIRSRCCGLIEVRDSVVEVLHKSVLDFLAEDNVWDTILSMTRNFDPNIALISATLHTIKVLPKQEVNFDVLILHYLRYCQLREKVTNRAQLQAMDDLVKVLAVQRPEMLSKLSRQICLAGLSYHVDYLLEKGSKERMEDMDIPPIIVHIIEAMITSPSTIRHYRYYLPTLTNEYIHILKALLTYSARNPSEYKAGRRYAWVDITRQLKNLTQDRRWIDSYSELNTISALLAVVEFFLDQGADVNIASWESTSRSSGPYFLVSEVLLDWLTGVKNRLLYQSKEDAQIEAKVDELRNRINDRLKEHSAKAHAQWLTPALGRTVSWETWIKTHYTLPESGHLGAEVRVVEGIHELPVMDWGTMDIPKRKLRGFRKLGKMFSR